MFAALQGNAPKIMLTLHRQPPLIASTRLLIDAFFASRFALAALQQVGTLTRRRISSLHQRRGFPGRRRGRGAPGRAQAMPTAAARRFRSFHFAYAHFAEAAAGAVERLAAACAHQLSHAPRLITSFEMDAILQEPSAGGKRAVSRCRLQARFTYMSADSSFWA